MALLPRRSRCRGPTYCPTLNMEIVTVLLGAIKELFGWKRAREERANSPEMRKNEEAQRDAGLSSSETQTVVDSHKTHNLDAIRKEAAE